MVLVIAVITGVGLTTILTVVVTALHGVLPLDVKVKVAVPK